MLPVGYVDDTVEYSLSRRLPSNIHKKNVLLLFFKASIVPCFISSKHTPLSLFETELIYPK